MNYKNAWKCDRCPKTGGPDGCPAWWEFARMNVQTGEEKIEKMCGFRALPIFLAETIKAGNRPAAAIEGLRNAMVDLARPDRIDEKRRLT